MLICPFATCFIRSITRSHKITFWDTIAGSRTGLEPLASKGKTVAKLSSMGYDPEPEK